MTRLLRPLSPAACSVLALGLCAAAPAHAQSADTDPVMDMPMDVETHDSTSHHGAQADAASRSGEDDAESAAAHDHGAMDMSSDGTSDPDMSGHDMSGHTMSGHAMHSMDMSDGPMTGMDHSMHGASGAPVSDQPGNAPPPPIPTDHAADRYFDMSRMSAARMALYGHSKFSSSALLVDRLEYRANKGKGGYAWEAQAWFGGDIDRFVLDSNGEGSLGEAAETIELDAYWRHAIGPWFNLQAGVRHDFRPRDPQSTYALVGVEGLAPYMIETQGQLMVSQKGDVHARASASYEQRITRSLMVEPEAEVSFAFQDVPELGIGAGFEKLGLSARLLYDRNRSFAPYVGVNWERSLGKTARWSDEDPSQVSATIGVRALF